MKAAGIVILLPVLLRSGHGKLPGVQTFGGPGFLFRQ
jgi:hypothetical protein